jgi:dolichyl-phosphate beta-glucosyltransferase
MSRPDLSVVLPCYRAGALALDAVPKLNASLSSARVPSWEIVVVDDGGGDVREAAFADLPRVRVISHSVNRGKGAAVTTGMLAATGRVRLFTDIDLPYGIAPILACLHLVRDRGFHLVVGDRTLASSRAPAPVGLARRIASRAASVAVGTLVTGGFFDTQCGLKAVRDDVAVELFPLLRIRRFAFDVELIYLALHHGLEIKRLPVSLERNETSSVRVLRDSAVSAIDIVRIKYHQLASHYRAPALEALVERELEASVHAARGAAE